MSSEHLHYPAGPLRVAVVLAATAGLVDAHVYLDVVPVFVANMSGNLVRLGMAAGERNWLESLGSGLSILAFAAGVIVGTVHHDRRRRRGLGIDAWLLVAVESVLLLALAGWIRVNGIEFSETLTVQVVPVIVLAAFSMGLQTASLRMVGQVAVATTYGTGAIVRISEKSVLAVRRADRAVEHRRRQSVVVLCSVVGSYVVGAAIAAAVGSSEWMLVAAAVAVGWSCVVLRRG